MVRITQHHPRNRALESPHRELVGSSPARWWSLHRRRPGHTPETDSLCLAQMSLCFKSRQIILELKMG